MMGYRREYEENLMGCEEVRPGIRRGTGGNTKRYRIDRCTLDVCGAGYEEVLAEIQRGTSGNMKRYGGGD